MARRNDRNDWFGHSFGRDRRPHRAVESPEEVPPAQSHDEPPGSSGHHGASGTLNVNSPSDPADEPLDTESE